VTGVAGTGGAGVSRRPSGGLEALLFPGTLPMALIEVEHDIVEILETPGFGLSEGELVEEAWRKSAAEGKAEGVVLPAEESSVGPKLGDVGGDAVGVLHVKGVELKLGRGDLVGISEERLELVLKLRPGVENRVGDLERERLEPVGRNAGQV
jgi:hypothetical protein